MDTTWDLSSSPFIVSCGGVAVASGATLTIAPGVVVRFASGVGCSGFALLGLSINGGLVASGTAAQPITFTSSTDDAASSWHPCKCVRPSPAGLSFYAEDFT